MKPKDFALGLILLSLGFVASPAQQPAAAEANSIGTKITDQDLAGHWRASLGSYLPNGDGDTFDVAVEINNVINGSADMLISGRYRILGVTIAEPLTKIEIVTGQFDWKDPKIGDEFLGMHLVDRNTLTGTYRGNYFRRLEIITFTRSH